jgi:hypothetical protein
MRLLLLVILSASASWAHAAPVKQVYQSAFEAYETWQAVPASNWVEANRRVHDIGGWRHYASEPYQMGRSTSKGNAHQHHSMAEQ